MMMMNRASYVAADPIRNTGKGSIEVTINGETRRLYAIKNGSIIRVWGILGRLKGDDRQWQLHLYLYRKGQKDIEKVKIYNVEPEDAPSLRGKTWESFAFGKVWQVSL